MLWTIAAAVTVGVILLALARRWSEIPSQGPARPPDRAGRIAAEAMPRPDRRPCDADDEEEEDDAWDSSEVPDRILVDHPLIRRAALKAIQESAGAARFFVIENEALYFVPDALPDSAERARASAILLQVQVGSATDAVDLAEVLWLAQRISRG